MILRKLVVVALLLAGVSTFSHTLNNINAIAFSHKLAMTAITFQKVICVEYFLQAEEKCAFVLTRAFFLRNSFINFCIRERL